jgi:hypothetical protein
MNCRICVKDAASREAHAHSGMTVSTFYRLLMMMVRAYGMSSCQQSTIPASDHSPVSRPHELCAAYM